MRSRWDPLTEQVSRNASFAFEVRWLAGAGALDVDRCLANLGVQMYDS